MTVKRNWCGAKVVKCDDCGKQEPLWRAVMAGSGWRARMDSRVPQHYCPICHPWGTFQALAG